MKQIIYSICFFALSLNTQSQNSIDNVLAQIEKNNTTLKAIRSNLDAEKIGNNTGKYLQNPEVEFHYLWSNPSTMGNRTDITIKQGFDFPTAYKHRNNISELKNQQTESEYNKQLREVLLNAKLICLDLVYSNALKREIIKRKNHAFEIADSYSKKYEVGESNILEYNKVKLALLNLTNDLSTIEIEIEALVCTLTGLNGGIKAEFNQSEFLDMQIPENFDQWYTNAEQYNPVLNWIKQEIEVNQAQEKYVKAMSLPKIEAGYMSEAVVGEKFQGVVVGLSIPLWENKNTVKYIKGNTIAYKDMEADSKLQFYNRLLILHTKAVKLKQEVDFYRQQLELLNNSDLLKKALDNGEISLIEYIYEFSVYYESIDSLLELELDLGKTVAELNQYM